MANLDKDIVITPNKDQTADPSIAFSGANATVAAQTIYANVYPLNGGTISFEGSAGQLFSITNTLSGTIFSVNDVSGIPSIEVMDTGVIRLAQYNGNVGIGTSTAQAGYKLQVTGNTAVTGRVGIGTSNIFGVSNALVVYGSAMVYGNLDLANPTGGTSGIYFNDGTYQTTAAVAGASSSGIAGTVQYSGGSGTFAGDANNFFYDSGNSRLGIGTGSPTNTLSAWGITPAWFRTSNGSNIFEVLVGNATTTAATLGYASTPTSPYSYIKNAGGTNGIAVVNNGSVGVKGITNPQSALDVGGAVAIGTAYAGVTAGPTNGLAVQGTVGIGTSTPQASSILSVAAPSVPKINLQVGAIERAYLQYDESASLVTLDSDAAVRFNTNNTERVRIDSFGNVSIGTASVLYPLGGRTALQVNGTTTALIGLSTGGTNRTFYDFDGTNTRLWADGSGGSLGLSTNSSNPITFGTNANERVRIDATGNVGINNTSPLYRVHVNNVATVGTSATVLATAQPILYLDNGAGIGGSIVIKAHSPGNGNQVGAIKFAASPDATNYSWAGIAGIADTNSAASALAFYTSASNSQATAAGASTERMRIDINGNVGIGTTVPLGVIDAAGSTASNLQAVLTRGTSDTNFQLIARNGVSGTATGTEMARFGMRYGSSDTWNAGFRFIRGGGASDGYMALDTSGLERVRIDANGNVGIGSTTPLAALVVTRNRSNGSVYADMIMDARTMSYTTSGSGQVIAFGNQTENGGAVGGYSNGTSSGIGIWSNPTITNNLVSGTPAVYVYKSNLLIGTTTAPAGGTATVVIRGSGTNGSGIEFSNVNVAGANIGIGGSNSLVFSTFTGAIGSETYTERMRLESSGNVTIAGNITVTGTVFSGSLPIVLNDVSYQTDGVRAVFPLKVNQNYYTSIVDSKNLEVVVNGDRLSPYVKQLTYPWFTNYYGSWPGYRVSGGNVIIYNAPDKGSRVSLVVVNNSTEQQTQRYPYLPTTIVLGD